MVCHNTPTTMMLMPFALGILEKVDAANPTKKKECQNFGIGIMLGIAYAASCGGMATPIGCTPNLVLVGTMKEEFGRDHAPTFAE